MGGKRKGTSKLPSGKQLGPRPMEDKKMTTTYLKEYTHSLKKEQKETITDLDQGMSSREANGRPRIHKVSTWHAYIYGQVRNIKTGHSHITKKMIDQGNLLGAGVGIN